MVIKSDICFHSVARRISAVAALSIAAEHRRRWMVEWENVLQQIYGAYGFHVRMSSGADAERAGAGECLTTSSHAYETTHSKFCWSFSFYNQP